ncbi:MAG: hypothetical protein IIY94_08810 [Oscillospiraceae bacterium]|nr:hypothetical protein [Oscillospiraceae bacterium]
MEEREFASCYQKLIAHYRLTPERNERQLAGILCRIRGPSRDPCKQKEEKKEARAGGAKDEKQTSGREA